MCCYCDSPERADNGQSSVSTTLLGAYRGRHVEDAAATSSLISDASLMLDERRFNEDGSFIGQYYNTMDKSNTLQNGNYQSMQETL